MRILDEMPKVGMLSLGCPRNLVDSEVMLGLLERAGYELSEEVVDSDIAIINTCAFIRQAEEESIDAILQLGQLKKERRIKALIVTGCLPQRYKETKLDLSLREVDALVGSGDHPKIVEICRRVLNGERAFEVTFPKFIYDHSTPRSFITPPHFAYVKVAEGCDHHCSYCIIAKLRGRYRSRSIDSILKEARSLSQRRVKEINLISQDTTSYGRDLYGRNRLPELLEGLADLSSIRWIRLLYTHPAKFSDELIKTIATSPNICKYIDLPLQHINDRILAEMGRSITKEDILNLIDRLRSGIPDLALRTTFIVGFPGETEEEFEELLGFMGQIRFERLGIFTYSREEGTPAYSFSNQIPQKVKERRFDEAMKLQQDISKEQNLSLLGRVVEVLVDERDPNDPDLFLARTARDAPEVDGQVFVQSKNAKVGEFLKVRITDTLEYDLVGEGIEK